jgi:hypothetical protein
MPSFYCFNSLKDISFSEKCFAITHCDRPKETVDAVKVPIEKFIFIHCFIDLILSDTATPLPNNNKHGTL